MRYGILTIGLAALALGGCASDVYKAGNIDGPDFGRALRQNVAAQVADPSPDYDRTEPPASSGPRTELAQDRYEKGAVIKPETQGTTSGGGGSGN